MYEMESYTVAVIGAGHAGVEAALSCARMGCKTVLFTISLDQIANMPCNPSIGGTAKGGSTSAFACQRAAIAPLPCPNLQLVSQRQSISELASFKKCNCSRENRLQN